MKFDIKVNQMQIINWWLSKNWIEWSKVHLNYGIRCFLSGVFLELKSRVDILMLGFFLSDYEVGIYSFSALFAEGFFQVLIVLQRYIFCQEASRDYEIGVTFSVSFSKRKLP